MVEIDIGVETREIEAPAPVELPSEEPSPETESPVEEPVEVPA